MSIASPAISPRLGWVAAFASLGYLAAAMPCWLHGLHAAAGWSGLSALAGVGIELAASRPGVRSRRSDNLACMAAVCAGISLDFALVPPLSMMAVCSSGTDSLAALFFTAHLRWFPATSLAMLALILCRHARPSPYAWLRAAIEFACMLAVMSLTMQAFKILAGVTGWTWSANGMTSAMIVGMSIFAYAPLRQCFRRLDEQP